MDVIQQKKMSFDSRHSSVSPVKCCERPFSLKQLWLCKCCILHHAHSLISPQKSNPPKTSFSGPAFNYAGDRRTISEILLTDFWVALECGLNRLQLKTDDRHTDAGIQGRGNCERAVHGGPRIGNFLHSAALLCCRMHAKCLGSS